MDYDNDFVLMDDDLDPCPDGLGGDTPYMEPTPALLLHTRALLSEALPSGRTLYLREVARMRIEGSTIEQCYLHAFLSSNGTRCIDPWVAELLGVALLSPPKEALHLCLVCQSPDGQGDPGAFLTGALALVLYKRQDALLHEWI